MHHELTQIICTLGPSFMTLYAVKVGSDFVSAREKIAAQRALVEKQLEEFYSPMICRAKAMQLQFARWTFFTPESREQVINSMGKNDPQSLNLSRTIVQQVADTQGKEALCTALERARDMAQLFDSKYWLCDESLREHMLKIDTLLEGFKFVEAKYGEIGCDVHTLENQMHDHHLFLYPFVQELELKEAALKTQLNQPEFSVRLLLKDAKLMMKRITKRETTTS